MQIMLCASACQSPTVLGLLEAAHEEAQQAAVAALGVDAFGGGGALLVDRLGRLAAHALAPGRHTGSVAVPWRVRVARRIARLRHRREHHDTRRGQRLDVGELGEAAVDQVLARALPVGCGQPLAHRPQLALVGAACCRA